MQKSGIFVSRMVEEFSPQWVILFGSHAQGDATPARYNKEAPNGR
jgi:hypothetical protein